jgi:hypothetical protein
MGALSPDASQWCYVLAFGVLWLEPRAGWSGQLPASRVMIGVAASSEWWNTVK